MIKVNTHFRRNVERHPKTCNTFVGRFTNFETWKLLPMNVKISVILRVVGIFVCLLFVLSGKPPAHSQTHSVVSEKDETQDIQLGQLSDFKQNQAVVNADMAKAIKEVEQKAAANEAEISSIIGWQKGGFGVLTVLSALAIFFQLKKKGD